jgi:hypothetical protein
MNLHLVQAFFLWCTILNLALLTAYFLIFLVLKDAIYKLHSRWFPMPRETFNAILYGVFAGYKILFIVFNLMPLIALIIVRHRAM